MSSWAFGFPSCVPTSGSARATPLNDIEMVLQSRYHEARLFALLVMVDHFKRGDKAVREALYKSYLAQTAWIKNWTSWIPPRNPIIGGWARRSFASAAAPAGTVEESVGTSHRDRCHLALHQERRLLRYADDRRELLHDRED